MKPFAVSCTTCRARLKVLDPSAIGQIIACPKCHSMVQVEPPPDWTPDEEPAASGTNGQAVVETPLARPTAAAVAPAAATTITPATVPRPVATAPAMPTALPVARVIAPNAAKPVPIAKAVAAKPVPVQPVVAQPIPAQPAVPHPIPKAQAAATVTKAPAAAKLSAPHVRPFGSTIAAVKASQWFWPAVAGSVVFVVAAGAMVIYRNTHRVPADPTVVVTPSIASPTTSPLVATAKTSPTQPVATRGKNTERPAEPKPPLAVSRVAPPSSTTPVHPPATVAALKPIAPQPPAGAIPPARPAIAPPPAVAIADNADRPPAEPTSPAATANPPAQPAMPGPTLQRIAPRNVDVAAQLAGKIDAIDFQQMPLPEFLAELSQMSTMPVSLDVDALAEMNLPADMPISVRLKNTTLAGVLDQALSPLGLAWRPIGHRIEVGRAASQEMRQVRYTVADLAASPESRRDFAAMVHSLIEPSGWSEAEGTATSGWSDGALVVNAGPSAHAQLLVFCEKLRLARGLPLRSHGDPNRFHLDSRTDHSKTTLDTPITANFPGPKSLESILAYLRGATHLNLLVDYGALDAAGLSAESESILTAQQQPFGQALSALLEPLDLTYRVVDERTIQITTTKGMAQHAEIEFYPAANALPAGSDGHELIARISRQAAAGDSSRPQVTIEFDPPSKYLIVRAPQNIQRRIESLLSNWHVAKQ